MHSDFYCYYDVTAFITYSYFKAIQIDMILCQYFRQNPIVYIKKAFIVRILINVAQ